jgi:hypothetical protein
MRRSQLAADGIVRPGGDESAGSRESAREDGLRGEEILERREREGERSRSRRSRTGREASGAVEESCGVEREERAQKNGRRPRERERFPQPRQAFRREMGAGTGGDGMSVSC